jgi:hypothetical protein
MPTKLGLLYNISFLVSRISPIANERGVIFLILLLDFSASAEKASSRVPCERGSLCTVARPPPRCQICPRVPTPNPNTAPCPRHQTKHIELYQKERNLNVIETITTTNDKDNLEDNCGIYCRAACRLPNDVTRERGTPNHRTQGPRNARVNPYTTPLFSKLRNDRNGKPRRPGAINDEDEDGRLDDTPPTTRGAFSQRSSLVHVDEPTCRHREGPGATPSL